MAEDDKPGPLKRAMAKVGIGDAAEDEQRDDTTGDGGAEDTSGRSDDQQTDAKGSGDGGADGEQDGQAPQNESSDDTAGGEQDQKDPKSEGSDDSSDEEDGSGSDDGEKSEEERAQETMRELEKDPPQDLNEWPGPGDKAMYQTFAINEEGWKGTTLDKLGPSSLRRFDDGSVTVEGEKVDNPDEYKGEPIPGGPTDESTPDD
jgi:hypothetical protein